VKFALAIISINIVNVGRTSISHNDWQVHEVHRETSEGQRLISIWGFFLPQIDYHSLV